MNLYRSNVLLRDSYTLLRRHVEAGTNLIGRPDSKSSVREALVSQGVHPMVPTLLRVSKSIHSFRYQIPVDVKCWVTDSSCLHCRLLRHGGRKEVILCSNTTKIMSNTDFPIEVERITSSGLHAPLRTSIPAHIAFTVLYLRRHCVTLRVPPMSSDTVRQTIWGVSSAPMTPALPSSSLRCASMVSTAAASWRS